MQVDHFHSRRVTNVGGQDNKDGQWWIELEGGVKITNTDPKRTLPKTNIVGEYFLSTELSATKTVLNIGHYDDQSRKWVTVLKVGFTPTEYHLTDPDTPEPVYPQRAEVVTGYPDPWPNTLQGPPPGSDSPLAAQEGAETSEMAQEGEELPPAQDEA